MLDKASPVGDWPLVGRSRELEAIAAARRDPACRGVVLVAPAGVGKSRLAREATAAAASEGAVVEWVQATRSAATIPLAAVAALVPEAARSDDVVQLLRRCTESLAERAGRRPIVIGVDDAQLLDPVSAALVLHLVSTSTAFVLATLRDGSSPPDAVVSLWKDAGARRLALGELTDDEVRTLAEAALRDPVEEAALRWVTDVSRGNALYVRELITGAVDAGTLRHVAGFWRLHGEPAASSSLADLIRERLTDLPDDARTAVELLALGEPLRLGELEALASPTALLAAEARGLLAVRNDEVRLAHPLYGEAVRAALPALRARRLRVQLAETLRARTPFRPDDALRVARLRVDAGSELDDELLLDAARAANRAGDPEFGAELAARADGLPAAMLLAQAQAMRNRYAEAEATLAAAEDAAAGHPEAAEYLRQRARLLALGLRRPDEVAALLDRAAVWPDPAPSPKLLDRLRQAYAALGTGAETAAQAAQISADPNVGDEQRRAALALLALSLLLAGRGDDAAGLARGFRPPVPLRDTGDSAMLAVLAFVSLESGHDWPALQTFMADALRDGVRARDDDAAGVAALALARLASLQGRYTDALRWLAEADVHLQLHDPYGRRLQARSLEVEAAAATGDFDAATAALERLRSSTNPVWSFQRAYVLRAEGAAARLRNALEAGRQLLAAAQELSEMPGVAASLAYEALRAGGPAVTELDAFEARSGCRLISAFAAHARARAAGDGTALLAAADTFGDIGAIRYAVEAASEAATAFVHEGRQDSARRAAHRAESLHVPGQGADLPRIDGLDAVAIALTRREAQLVEMAAQGLSNAEIADRLVLSVRTVETHLYRAMQKLGVSDRRDL